MANTHTHAHTQWPQDFRSVTITNQQPLSCLLNKSLIFLFKQTPTHLGSEHHAFCSDKELLRQTFLRSIHLELSTLSGKWGWAANEQKVPYCQ